MHIIVKQKKHELYNRKGDDLIYIHKITLKEALLGFSFDILALNKQKVSYQSDQIICPDSVNLRQINRK